MQQKMQQQQFGKSSYQNYQRPIELFITDDARERENTRLSHPIPFPSACSTTASSIPVQPAATKSYVSSTSSLTTSKSGFFIQFDLGEEVGMGSTAKCFKCLRKADSAEFACKVINKRQGGVSSALIDQFCVEIKVMRLLQHHPNIIKLEDVFETPERIYLVMEMMKGGELFDYVVRKGTLSEEEASVIVRKITSAVAFLHSNQVIHRDLKPENLLLTSTDPADCEVKLIDFGLAKILSTEVVARSFLGTKGYLAPEMLLRGAYDKAVDVWALGVIVFILLCGCMPFDEDSSRIENASAARKRFVLKFPNWTGNLSAGARDLMMKLLDVNPKTRLTAEEAMQHQWVSGRSVQHNNYLQSPTMISERRRELSSSSISTKSGSHKHTSTSDASPSTSKMDLFHLTRKSSF